MRADCKRYRMRDALVRRKANLADWEAGKFPDPWLEVITQSGPDMRAKLVAMKIAKAKEEIAVLEKRLS